MLFAIAALLVLLWIVGGFIIHVGGVLIHALLVLAVVVILWNFIRGRGGKRGA